ncbi:hypothetical protein MesoLjLc_54280 [Mesorhizobium sp. L-8-10]|uniref:NUDIX hydrolase n=1 Tax=Mesorhizobium sp. L-8-10 TaxID=2744523 RepID=UPI0019260B52|nr:NUDIX hydrolase [Mesorhizobium sp. L-8-10]BCH33498.1 hypothetical protein MesoLjLc_54280 [Mesorhizobium sp. L-8-10]
MALMMEAGTPCGAFGATLQQFGALPWRRSRSGGIEILLITTRRTGRWILPRGWPVKAKTPAQTAAREAFEEAGVIGSVDPRPVGEYSYVKTLADGSENDCLVTLFSLQVHGTLVNWPERNQRQRRWHGLDQACEAASDRQLAGLLATLDWNRKAA